MLSSSFFFFNDTATTEIYTLSLHDALPILRDQVRRLLEGWTLADPNPGAYGAALQRMARAAPDRAVTPEGEHATEPDRIVAMALEVDTVNAHVLAAADRVVQEGRLGQLLDALAEVSESPGAAREVWARLATADVVRQLATRDPVDLDRKSTRLNPVTVKY